MLASGIPGQRGVCGQPLCGFRPICLLSPSFPSASCESICPLRNTENGRATCKIPSETTCPLTAYLNWLEKERERGGLPKATGINYWDCPLYGRPRRRPDHFVKARNNPGSWIYCLPTTGLLGFSGAGRALPEPALERAAEFLPRNRAVGSFGKE